MARLGDNRWGKAQVRVSKLLRGEEGDDFVDITVRVLLRGEVEAAYLQGDNAGVIPTDTMRNTVYAFAHDHLAHDLEGFGRILAQHHADRFGVDEAMVELSGRRWQRVTATGFVGGSSERRTARVVVDAAGVSTRAGIDGLVVLKTGGSAFAGFPRDEFTTLAETQDRILSTTISAEWPYSSLPPDTTATWERARSIMLDHFFTDSSQSAQHQGWMMGRAVLDAVPEMSAITFRLPNQHHLGFDLSRFLAVDEGIVFHPVSEPYGDIIFTVDRD